MRHLHNFRLLNLCTKYKYSLYLNNDVAKNTPWDPEPASNFNAVTKYFCFYNLFQRLKSFKHNENISMNLEILINSDIDRSYKEQFNNLTVLSKSQIINHIEYLKKLFDFEYHLNYMSHEGYYSVCVNFLSVKPIQIKFFCAWIRYLYEFPANVLMLDIYRLIDAGLLKEKEESLFNLIIALNSSINPYNISIRSDQCISIFGRFQEEKELKTKLNRGRNYLNSLYLPISDDRTTRIRNITAEFEKSYKLINFEMYTLDFWLSEDRLADRWILYEKVIAEYKK